jgi:metallo-beta-lactamase class B
VRALIWLGVVGYPKIQVDHRFKDGDIVNVGPIALKAHITGGHTRGCTSWSFKVRDGERELNVVSACDLGRLATSQYPEQSADLERSFKVLRELPVDIWVTCHARNWGRYRKFVASTAAQDPVAPFIDLDGYRAFIDAAEAELRDNRLH